MNPYIAALNEHLRTHPPEYGDSNITSLLEFLWRSYSAYNPIHSEQILSALSPLEAIFDSLPYDDANLLFDQISTLCLIYEREALMSGIHIGARLAMELERGMPAGDV